MSHEIVNLDDHRPHITISCADGVHVMPVSLMKDVISGKKCLTQIESWGEIIKPILKHFLDGLVKDEKNYSCREVLEDNLADAAVDLLNFTNGAAALRVKIKDTQPEILICVGDGESIKSII